jgi:RNA polymerase sigma-70 factor (ECF subfamily)
MPEENDLQSAVTLPNDAHSLFSRTRWSLVRRASRHDDDSQEALGELLSIYWYPLYAWARRRGLSPEDASDGVQGFIHKLCDRKLLSQVEEGRGKLRSWLLRSFRNYLTDEAVRGRREKRGGGAEHVHIDWSGAENAYLAEPGLITSPDALYARTWALSLMDEALERVARYYTDSGRSALFEALLPALESPLPEQTYSMVAADLRMSPAAVRQSAVRLRERYRRTLLELAAIRLGVTSEAQLDQELRELLNGT